MAVAMHPMRVPGSWREGYVLDYHTKSSEFLGYDEYGHPRFETIRTEVGELLYRLKYRGRKDALAELVAGSGGLHPPVGPRGSGCRTRSCFQNQSDPAGHATRKRTR